MSGGGHDGWRACWVVGMLGSGHVGWWASWIADMFFSKHHLSFLL